MVLLCMVCHGCMLYNIIIAHKLDGALHMQQHRMQKLLHLTVNLCPRQSVADAASVRRSLVPTTQAKKERSVSTPCGHPLSSLISTAQVYHSKNLLKQQETYSKAHKMPRQSGLADREPCPWRIVDDVGGAFCSKCCAVCVCILCEFMCLWVTLTVDLHCIINIYLLHTHTQWELSVVVFGMSSRGQGWPRLELGCTAVSVPSRHGHPSWGDNLPYGEVYLPVVIVP